MQTIIRCDQPAGALAPFWNGTGFTPGELLLTQDIQQALTYYGSVPHAGITFVRIHYLLELVRVNPSPNGSPQYDWSLLDEGLSWLVRNHLKPFFEVMGNPSAYYTDFNDARQLHLWKEMVRQLAEHLMERFGRAEVESWYFETWNEPDGGWWPQWPHDEGSFCNYYDATSEGLLAANPQLTFGGPGTCRTLSSLFKTVMAHCDSGKNYFTGERGVRLQFISIHEKGATATPEEINPNTSGLWQREAQIVDYLRAHHPRLAQLPFMNNECDPQVGWWHIHTWHARPYYAALACKVVNQHLRGLVDEQKVNYTVLSNDNGFIGTWGNRTLLTRFGQPDLIEDGQSRHKSRLVAEGQPVQFPPFELVKKPIFNAWVMLSLLGDTRCQMEPAGAADDELGLIATRRGSDQVAVLVYHSRDRIQSNGSSHVTLRLEGLPFSEAALVHYRIDETHGDPYTLWETPPTKERQAPALPSAPLYAALRARQELEALAEPEPVRAEQGALTLEFDLPLHAVSLVLLSARPAAAPAVVSGVQLESYPGLTGQREVMVTWQGLESRVIRTYQVLRAATPSGPFERVNPADLLCSAYLDVFEPTGQPVYYQVRAIDYWGRAGAASEVIALA